MEYQIIDRGRGPEIAGTRITVYDIMDYYTQDWHHTAIAAWLSLSSAQVLTAIKYIEEHKEEVMADYQEILDRCARGNPPELQAKLNALVGSARAKRDELRRREQEMNGEGSSRGHQPQGPPVTSYGRFVSNGKSSSSRPTGIRMAQLPWRPSFNNRIHRLASPSSPWRTPNVSRKTEVTLIGLPKKHSII